MHALTYIPHIEFEVHGLCCHASLARFDFIPLGSNCFWDPCLAFVRPAHLGALWVVFGAKHAAPGCCALGIKWSSVLRFGLHVWMVNVEHHTN